MSIHKIGFTTSAVERREEIDPPHVWWEPKKDITHLPYREMGGSRWEIFRPYSKRDNYSVQVGGYIRPRSRCTND